MRGPGVLLIEFALAFHTVFPSHDFVVLLVLFGVVFIPLAFYSVEDVLTFGGELAGKTGLKARRALPEQHSTRSATRQQTHG